MPGSSLCHALLITRNYKECCEPTSEFNNRCLLCIEHHLSPSGWYTVGAQTCKAHLKDLLDQIDDIDQQHCVLLEVHQACQQLAPS